MSELIHLEETFFVKTREALLLLENKEEAEAALKDLLTLEDQEMQLIISRAALQQGLTFDLEEKTKHIKTLLAQAFTFVKEDNIKQARKTLEKILKLQQELLKKSKDRRNEKILAVKIILDGAIALLLRFVLDPVAQAVGQRMDVLQAKVENLDILAKEKAKGTEEYKTIEKGVELGKEKFNNVKKW